MSARVTAFESLIPPDFTLSRNGSFWIIEEPDAGNSRFEIAAGKSHAFTLDQGGLNVFPFFSVALNGIKAVNDALVVTVVDGQPYVMAVEMKTSPGQIGDALKQIESGRVWTLVYRVGVRVAAFLWPLEGGRVPVFRRGQLEATQASSQRHHCALGRAAFPKRLCLWRWLPLFCARPCY